MTTDADALEELTFLMLYQTDRSVTYVAANEEHEIDAAVQRWVDSGKHLDTLLSLTTVSSARFVVLASTITSWCISTSESRAYSTALDRALERAADAEKFT